MCIVYLGVHIFYLWSVYLRCCALYAEWWWWVKWMWWWCCVKKWMGFCVGDVSRGFLYKITFAQVLVLLSCFVWGRKRMSLVRKICRIVCVSTFVLKRLGYDGDHDHHEKFMRWSGWWEKIFILERMKFF